MVVQRESVFHNIVQIIEKGELTFFICWTWMCYWLYLNTGIQDLFPQHNHSPSLIVIWLTMPLISCTICLDIRFPIEFLIWFSQNALLSKYQIEFNLDIADSGASVTGFTALLHFLSSAISYCLIPVLTDTIIEVKVDSTLLIQGALLNNLQKLGNCAK